MSKPKLLYALQECPRGLIKIGIAVDPEKRRGDLATGNPRPVVLIGSREFTRDVQVTEHDIRLRFASAVIHGEWFRPTPDFLRFVEDTFIYGYPVAWLEST